MEDSATDKRCWHRIQEATRNPLIGFSTSPAIKVFALAISLYSRTAVSKRDGLTVNHLLDSKICSARDFDDVKPAIGA